MSDVDDAVRASSSCSTRHAVPDGFGNGSPVAALEAAGADVVLIGVGHDNNTSLHLAEVRAVGDVAPRIRDGVPTGAG